MEKQYKQFRIGKRLITFTIHYEVSKYHRKIKFSSHKMDEIKYMVLNFLCLFIFCIQYEVLPSIKIAKEVHTLSSFM